MQGPPPSGPAMRTILTMVILVSSAFLVSPGATAIPAGDPEFSHLLTTGPAQQDGILEASNFTSYFDHNTMTEHLMFLEQSYPDLVKLWSIGQTHEGREIWCVKVSDRVQLQDDGYPGSEPNALLVGAHHGNEWISYEVALYVLNFLLQHYGGDDENGTMATYLVDTRETYFVPMLNADGVQYSHEQERGWRKNREPNYVNEFGPTKIITPDLVPISYGVDINRNYGWAWHEAGGSNVVVTSGSSYRGPPDNVDNDGDAIIQIDLTPGYLPLGPDEGVDEDPWDGVDNDNDGEVDEDPAGGFSSLETIAMRKLGDSHQFPVAITYHSYSELILWPWGNTPEPPRDAPVLEKLGTRMAEMNGYRPMQGYELYPVTGEFNDWFYSQYGTFGYTFEVGRQHNIPADEIIEHCERNLLPSLYLIHSADNPYGSYVRFNENSTVCRAGRDGMDIELSFVDEGYPIPWSPDEARLHYRWGDKPWKSLPVTETREGNLTAFVPREYRDIPLSYYFEMVDTNGGRITEPLYAPYQTHVILFQEETGIHLDFSFGTWMVLLFTLGVIWGGFGGGIVKAMRSQRRRDALGN